MNQFSGLSQKQKRLEQKEAKPKLKQTFHSSAKCKLNAIWQIVKMKKNQKKNTATLFGLSCSVKLACALGQIQSEQHCLASNERERAAERDREREEEDMVLSA